MIIAAYEDWKSDIACERKARNVDISIDSMADWVYKLSNISETIGSPSTYRKTLVKKCPAFGIVRDVADCSKHLKLDRPDARVKHSSQLFSIRHQTFDDMKNFDAEDNLDELSVLVVDGVSEDDRYFRINVEASIKMWERELEELSL